MHQTEISKRLSAILSEPEMLTRQLRLAALLSELFREKGYDPVIVGGSAIEFYTDGAYVSGDIDVCFDTPPSPSPYDCEEIMGRMLGGTGSVRTWKIDTLYVDILGSVEAFALDRFRILETPDGTLRLQPLEDLIVERVFVARGMSQPNADAETCAKKLLSAVIAGEMDVDWNVVETIADSPAYRCRKQLEEIREEVEKFIADE